MIVDNLTESSEIITTVEDVSGIAAGTVLLVVGKAYEKELIRNGTTLILNLSTGMACQWGQRHFFRMHNI